MRRIHLWVLAAGMLSILHFIFQGFSFGVLSTRYIQRAGVYPYAVLGLCALLLFSKKEEIRLRMDGPRDSAYILMGLSLVVFSFFIPASSPALQLFALLLLWLGVFTAFYGRAAELPMALVGIYGFALAFPLIVSRLGSAFPRFTTLALASVLGPVLPLSADSQIISFVDAVGGSQTYFIDASCSGSAALAIFLAVFFLMLIDRPVPPRRALPLLVVGLVGTLFQNLVRLVILVFAGYFYGRDALWSVHTYAGYVLFPLWYAVFVYLYMREAKTEGVGKEKGSGAAPA